jgi:hypothetical protein
MPLSLHTLQRYGDATTEVVWRGMELLDEAEVAAYLGSRVAQRVQDAPAVEDLARDLQALATTEMATGTIQDLLLAEAPPQPWEVGEALAECLLEDELDVAWPWNMNRDRRTPRASLPGADLIGFVDLGNGWELVFGEVKTSSDQATPPGVMSGRSGMVHQLEGLAEDKALHWSLLKWLHPRCKGTESWPLFEGAASRYVESGGKALYLCGALMRDTAPADLDLTNRAVAFSASIAAPMHAHLTAWYVPVPIDRWCQESGLAQ